MRRGRPTLPVRLTRRRLMQAGLAAVLTTAAHPPRAAEMPPTEIAAVPSLGEIAKARGILFGTAIDVETLDHPRRAALYAHHARILTADSSMKFWNLRPEEGPANFERADRLVAFSEQHRIPLRGHNLVWNDFPPPWLAKLSRERVAYWLDRHIDEVVGRYAGRLHSWDVLNEPMFPMHGNPGGWRSGPWYDALGPDYAIRALKRARAADPAGRIVINEAGPEWQNPFGPAKPYRDGLLRLVKSAQDAGVRLDAVGLECHWFPQFTFEASAFRDVLGSLADTGVALYLTEIDVNDAEMAGDTPARDAEVGRRYRLLVETALRNPKVEIIETWQLSDDASWLTYEPKMWGPGGRKPRSLPFDDTLAPKAAYYELARAFTLS